MVLNSTRQQLFRYACVGLGANLLLYLAYLGLTSAGVGHKTAMTFLYATGVLLTFVANSSWSFARPSLGRMAFGRYLLAHGAGYTLNWILLWVAVDKLHLAHQGVQAAAIVLVAMVLFMLQKFWVFSARIDGSPPASPGWAKSAEGFRPGAFAELAVLEAANFWFRARNKLILWALRSNFPAMERYLEVGCGTGFVLEAVARSFPQVELVGTEYFNAGLEIAARRVPRAQLLQMDGRRMPFRDEFDVVGAFDVLEHIEEDEAVLAEIAQSLRPGGGVVLTVPQHPWLWSYPDEYACHVRRYKVGELREKVERAGFEVRLETSFVSLLLPAMLASRRGRRGAQQPADAMSDLRLPRLLDGALACVMGIERSLIRMGLRLPVGGSLLLVATKPSGLT